MLATFKMYFKELNCPEKNPMFLKSSKSINPIVKAKTATWLKLTGVKKKKQQKISQEINLLIKSLFFS